MENGEIEASVPAPTIRSKVKAFFKRYFYNGEYSRKINCLYQASMNGALLGLLFLETNGKVLKEVFYHKTK